LQSPRKAREGDSLPARWYLLPRMPFLVSRCGDDAECGQSSVRMYIPRPVAQNQDIIRRESWAPQQDREEEPVLAGGNYGFLFSVRRFPRKSQGSRVAAARRIRWVRRSTTLKTRVSDPQSLSKSAERKMAERKMNFGGTGVRGSEGNPRGRRVRVAGSRSFTPRRRDAKGRGGQPV
jgi:hypothetical protein